MGNTAAVVADDDASISLLMLIATGERALERFEAASSPPDPEFVADLESILVRAREELEILRVRSLLP